MNRRDDPNPFDEEAVNPFSNKNAAPGSKSRIPQMVANTLGFGQKHDANVDIPLDSMHDPKKKEKELAAWDADLKRRERDLKHREDVVASANVPTDDRNCPPFFPIIHHDIANEIPVNAQRLQYLAFASWLVSCKEDKEAVIRALQEKYDAAAAAKKKKKKKRHLKGKVDAISSLVPPASPQRKKQRTPMAKIAPTEPIIDVVEQVPKRLKVDRPITLDIPDDAIELASASSIACGQQVRALLALPRDQSKLSKMSASSCNEQTIAFLTQAFLWTQVLIENSNDLQSEVGRLKLLADKEADRASNLQIKLNHMKYKVKRLEEDLSAAADREHKLGKNVSDLQLELKMAVKAKVDAQAHWYTEGMRDRLLKARDVGFDYKKLLESYELDPFVDPEESDEETTND